MRSCLFISALVLLLSLAVPGSSSSTQQDPATVASPNKPAQLTNLPDTVLNAELRAVDGPSFRLADYSGKVRVIFLWATWCGPCRQQVSAMVKLQAKFRSREVMVVGLSTEDPDDSADSVREFVHNFKVNFRVGWSGQQVAVSLMQGRDAIPQSFVISRSGRVVKRFVGFNSKITTILLKQTIEEALKDEGALPEQK